MNISSLSKYALAAVASASILAACSGGQSGMGATGTMPSTAGGGNLMTEAVAHPMALNQPHSAGVIAPGKKGGSSYVYISGIYTNEVYVYNFAKGKFGTEVGTATSGISEPQGMCASKGNAWLANTGDSNLLEFKGGSTTSSGSLTDTGEYPADCSISKKGDIAVSNICSSPSCTQGDIAIFKGGTGSPTAVSCSNLYRYYFLAYDKKGNLWVDGEDSSGAFSFCEVAAGASSGTPITLNVNPSFPGGVQVSGKYVTILDQLGDTVDEYTISGTTGTEAHTITLSASGDDLVNDWFAGKYLLVSNLTTGQGDSFKKSGGSPYSTATASEALGITLVK